jgi:hypothetical protein
MLYQEVASQHNQEENFSMRPAVQCDHVIAPVVQHDNDIPRSSQGSKADKSIEIAPFQEMDQELVLTLPMLQHSGSSKEKIFP